MKRSTITLVMQSMCYGFAALLLTASCANDDTMLEGKQKKSDIPTGTTVFTGTSQPEATTRTAILNHTKGSDASVNWSSTDKIWVKDDGGHWQQSGAVTFPFATTTNNKAQGMFALSGTYTGSTHDILYTNKTISGTQPQVEIKATQTQSAPNNFDHAGESGDFGIATGNKAGGNYKFTLNHKAAYLCFIPRSSNPYVNRSRLIKVEIMSDDDIAGTYNIAANGTLTLASGGSKTISVTTGSGFAIDNSADDMSKNATYAVVAPGTHTFRIRYWLRNTTDNPDGPIEGTVSKIVTLNCTAGSIQDITANLDPHDYDGDHYYMWDAQQQYWYGYEWTRHLSGNTGQPTLNNNSSPNKPQSNSDVSRWYNEYYPGYGVSNPATHTSCKDLPNANEMSWYAMYGDPRRDADELWTAMVTYTKAVCGLRRSLCYWQRVITTQRNLPMVQPTCVQHTRATTTTAVVSTIPVSHPQPMQAITSTCPPWVTTTLVSCSSLASTATIGRQVLTHGTATARTTCTSAVVRSMWTTTPAATGSGSSRRFSSPRACLFTSVAL